MAGSFRIPDRIAFGRAYYLAGLPPSEHLVVGAEDVPEFSELSTDMPDLDALLDNLSDEAGAESMAIHMSLSGMMSTLPHPVRAMIVDQIARRPVELCARAGTYWLLDANPALRRAAADGFLQHALSGQMDATTVSRLVTIRSWLPADKSRDVLDRSVKEAIPRDVAGGMAPTSWKVHRVLASIPDGAGAQSIAVVAQSGGRRGIAMLHLKQGFGVKDAYVIPCSSASEQKRFLATIEGQIDPEDVTMAFVHAALATALGEGTETGLLPAPGLVDVAEVCGLHALRPEPRSVQNMLGAIARDGELALMSPQRLGRLVGRSADWPESHTIVDSWFEDSGAMHDSLATATTPRTLEREMWRHLESRRNWWARVFARTAVTLQAGDDPTWREFGATAIAIENGRDLKKTPIMEYIAQRSLENPDAPGSYSEFEESDESDIDYLDAPALVAPEKKDELARLLKASDISPDWLDGFLMAIVVSPKMITPQKWLKPLFDVLPDQPNEDSLQRFLDIVMLRYNAANEVAQDAIAIKARLNGLSAQAWVGWTAGFASETTGFKSSWPAGALNRDDKAILRQIGKTADSNYSRSLSALLLAWLALRHELQS